MRIVIIGTSGSGKSTLAKRLAAWLDLTHIELDAINWQPGWVGLHQTDPDEFLRRTEAAIAPDRWVCDGNYVAVRDAVWRRADHLIWLDYDRPVIMRRVIARSITRALDQQPLWNSNREDWRQWLHASHPIRWAWDTWADRRVRFEAALAEDRYAHLQVLRLRKPRQAEGIEGRLKGADSSPPLRSGGGG